VEIGVVPESLSLDMKDALSVKLTLALSLGHLPSNYQSSLEVKAEFDFNSGELNVWNLANGNSLHKKQYELFGKPWRLYMKIAGCYDFNVVETF